MMYIEMDDLVGNAFVSYLEKTEKRVLSLYKIEKFVSNIVKNLDAKGTKSMLLSRDRVILKENIKILLEE